MEDASGYFRGRALIVAPQATLRQTAADEDDETDEGPPPSQWLAELKQYAPHIPVHELFSWADYTRLVNRYGSLPDGIYVSYYESLFKNQSREVLPESWDHAKLCDNHGLPLGPMEKHFSLEIQNPYANVPKYVTYAEDVLRRAADWRDNLKVGDTVHYDSCYPLLVTDIRVTPLLNHAAGVGQSKHGIRCIVEPCLLTHIQMGHFLRAKELGQSTEPFDLAALDETHIACNLDAQVTQSILRLSAKYRYALTATPIPNIVSNLFSLMGWLCVPNWHLGKLRNPAWPYSVHDIEQFNETFLSDFL